ncbi:hypothetical protein QQP08_003722 [Theobroma cacao]|nr:hypothetical protein QQP08_003722 [Theobroma cacao]
MAKKSALEVKIIVHVEVHARRQNRETKAKDDKQEPRQGNESPSRESIGTSIEVQTGNSVEVFSAREESKVVHHRMQHKPKAQVLKIKV